MKAKKGKNMFISLSKTFARFGGFRLGFGMRLTKKNTVWMFFVLMFVWMLKLMWYMLILCFWLMYAIIYAMVWCIKALIRAIVKNKNRKVEE